MAYLILSLKKTKLNMNIKLKNSDVVCWYPSPMIDFKSILNWEHARGNKLQPNVFLFTDNLYSSHLINNYEDASVRFRNDFNNVDYRTDLINMLIFYNGSRIFKKGMACFSFNDKKIILIPHEYMTDSNQTFYKYIVNNSISIDCLYAKRTCDDFGYINTLTSIGVKEAMLGTMTDEEDSLIVRNNDFRYKKIGEPFQAIASINDFCDFVQLYNLLEVGVSDRAKLFVEKTIINNNDTMHNMIHYLFSEREPSEKLKDFMKSTVDKDIQTQEAFKYFNILPPITENLDDFVWAIIVFTKTLFNDEQIEKFTITEALFILEN